MRLFPGRKWERGLGASMAQGWRKVGCVQGICNCSIRYTTYQFTGYTGLTPLTCRCMCFIPLACFLNSLFCSLAGRIGNFNPADDYPPMVSGHQIKTSGPKWQKWGIKRTEVFVFYRFWCFHRKFPSKSSRSWCSPQENYFLVLESCCDVAVTLPAIAPLPLQSKEVLRSSLENIMYIL